MLERFPGMKTRPAPAALVAGALVAGGFLLTGVSWWFLVLTGLGTFGPGLLRELGWLTDRDEFQLQAARRAGYHAFLAAGMAAFLWMAFLRSAPRNLKNPEELATFFAAVLWFTWMFSSFVTYWGARRTAVRVLYVYGGAWLLFNIAGNLGSPLGMLMQCLLTLPFFACALLSRRWPRVAAALLLASSVFFFVFFRFHQESRLGLVVNAITTVLFIGPLFASGLALATRQGQEDPA